MTPMTTQEPMDIDDIKRPTQTGTHKVWCFDVSAGISSARMAHYIYYVNWFMT